MNQATKEFILTHYLEDINTLALRYHNKTEEIDLPFALQQIKGLQTIQKKVPSWFNHKDLLYPLALSLEQCSSETTAKYKATLIKRVSPSPQSSLIDLTGGMGIDFSFLAPLFTNALYLEREACLCHAAVHNFNVLGLQNTTVLNTDSNTWLYTNKEPISWIFIDPARRNIQGKKVVLLNDCEPNVLELLPYLEKQAEYVLLKLSPMIDLHELTKQLCHIKEIHIVAEKGECKEVLVLLEIGYKEEITIYCVDTNQTFCFSFAEEQQACLCYTPALKTYLYEPNASIMKAGAFKTIAQRWSLDKLHPNSHLYTSETLYKDFPGRVFEIEEQLIANKKVVQSCLMPNKKANLKVRNFPLSTAELKKKLGISDGGNIYLFATTLANEKKVILKTKKAF